MIKQISLILMIIIVGFTFVSAQTNSTELINPGTTPNSALYFLDLAIENLGLALTFDNGARMEKELMMAEERLAEAKEMALKNNLNAMAKAEKKHDKILTKLKLELKKIKAENSTEELKKELKIEKKINEHETKIKIVRGEIEIEIEIKGGVTPEQQKIIESILSNLEGKIGELEIEINDEKIKSKIKIENETGENGDDIEDELQGELEIENDNKIEIEVEGGIANVEVEINDIKNKFSLNIDNNQTNEQIEELVLEEIINRYSITQEELENIKIEFGNREDSDNQIGEEDEEYNVNNSSEDEEDNVNNSSEDEEDNVNNSSENNGNNSSEDDG